MSRNENQFYVYLWLRKRDLSPYYVGKGCKQRAFSKKDHYVCCPDDPSRIVIIPMTDEDTALAYEIYFIDFWGRKDLGTGILRNMTDGGEGLHNPSPIILEGLRRGGRTQGKIQGAKNVASGLWASLASIGGRVGGKIGGKISGRILAERGQMSVMGRVGGKIVGQQNVARGVLILANHVRWHVNRKTINLDCSLCLQRSSHGA